jgi:hypothetical protein
MPKKVLGQATGGHSLGSWAYLIGVVLALVFGLLGSLSANLTYILVVLGVIVGLFNIGGRETTPFLWAGVVMVVVAILGQSVMTAVPALERMLVALVVLFVPATVVVALVHVFRLAGK